MEADTEASWHCLTDPAVKDGTCVSRHEPDVHQLIKVPDSYLYIYMTRHKKLHNLTWRTQSWDSSYISKCGLKFGATHQWKNWIKQNLAEKFSRLPSTQDSCLPKTHAHLWKKSGKLEFQKCFFFKLEIFMWFLYQNSINVSNLCRALPDHIPYQVYNNSYIYCVAIIVKLVNSQIHIWLIWCCRRNILCNGWDEQLYNFISSCPALAKLEKSICGLTIGEKTKKTRHKLLVKFISNHISF